MGSIKIINQQNINVLFSPGLANMQPLREVFAPLKTPE
jgi:hypothetical protein